MHQVKVSPQETISVYLGRPSWQKKNLNFWKFRNLLCNSLLKYFNWLNPGCKWEWEQYAQNLPSRDGGRVEGGIGQCNDSTGLSFTCKHQHPKQATVHVSRLLQFPSSFLSVAWESSSGQLKSLGSSTCLERPQGSSSVLGTGFRSAWLSHLESEPVIMKDISLCSSFSL